MGKDECPEHFSGSRSSRSTSVSSENVHHSLSSSVNSTYFTDDDTSTEMLNCSNIQELQSTNDLSKANSYTDVCEEHDSLLNETKYDIPFSNISPNCGEFLTPQEESDLMPTYTIQIEDEDTLGTTYEDPDTPAVGHGYVCPSLLTIPENQELLPSMDGSYDAMTLTDATDQDANGIFDQESTFVEMDNHPRMNLLEPNLAFACPTLETIEEDKEGSPIPTERTTFQSPTVQVQTDYADSAHHNDIYDKDEPSSLLQVESCIESQISEDDEHKVVIEETLMTRRRNPSDDLTSQNFLLLPQDESANSATTNEASPEIHPQNVMMDDSVVPHSPNVVNDQEKNTDDPSMHEEIKFNDFAYHTSRLELKTTQLDKSIHRSEMEIQERHLEIDHLRLKEANIYTNPYMDPCINSNVNSTYSTLSNNIKMYKAGAETPIGDDDQLEKLARQQKRFEEKYPDIDKGWAWMVAISVFFAFSILSGQLFTCSLYYVEMLKQFGESRSYTAWVGSLVNAFFMLGSLASSSFIQRFSCRAAMILGSCVMTSGYILAAFATSLEMVFMTYGVIVASGMNLVFSSCILVLAQYFHRRHSLVTSMAMVGYGVGLFAMSQVLEYVIKEYGWRISFIFCAMVSMQLCVCGSLLYPLPPDSQASIFELEPSDDEASDSDDHHDFDFSDCDDEGDEKETKERGRKRMKRRSYRHEHLYYQRDLLNRSFSSLMLSVPAGYLSYSLASLGSRRTSFAHTSSHAHDVASGRGSTQHRVSRSRTTSRSISRGTSFLSRTSSILPAYLRSSQQSVSSKISSAQFSFTGVRSNQPSRISLKDSRLDLLLHGLRSNPHSFSLRHTSCDHHTDTDPLCCSKLDDLVEEDRSSSDEWGKGKMKGVKNCCRYAKAGERLCTNQLKDDDCGDSTDGDGDEKDKPKGVNNCCGDLNDMDAKLKGHDSSCCRDMKNNAMETAKVRTCCSHECVHKCLRREYHEKEQMLESSLGLDDEKKASFLISGGESEDEEDDEEEYNHSTVADCPDGAGGGRGVVRATVQGLKHFIQRCRFTPDPLLSDPCLWAFAFSYFFCLLGTLTMYVIFKDFMDYSGLESYYSLALSAAGIGDLIGRLGGGLIAASKVGNTILFYAVAMSLSAVILGSYLFISNGPLFIAAATVFGVLFGVQNLFIAVTPNDLFGREKLALVFGISVFLAGIGALIGSPLAGLIADATGGYAAVIVIQMICCLIGSGLMIVCYVMQGQRPTKQQPEKMVAPTVVIDSSASCDKRSHSASYSIVDKEINRNSQLLTNITHASELNSRVSHKDLRRYSHHNYYNIHHVSETKSKMHNQVTPDSPIRENNFLRILRLNGSIQSSTERCESFSRPDSMQSSLTSLKRTNTYDNIIQHNKPTHSRKKPTNLYEMMMEKKMAQIDRCQAYSDQDLPGVTNQDMKKCYRHSICATTNIL